MPALFSLSFHPAAVDELDAAIDWYERHTTGAGARLSAVDDCVMSGQAR